MAPPSLPRSVSMTLTTTRSSVRAGRFASPDNCSRAVDKLYLACHHEELHDAVGQLQPRREDW
eukprot:4308024-Prymnesium_polylepis.1